MHSPSNHGSSARFRSFSSAATIALWLVLTHVAGAADDESFVRLMNTGKAHLENRNSAQAIKAFASATELNPRSAPALRNLARAQMLGKQEEEAIKSLQLAAEIEKDSAAINYLTGLAHVHRSRFKEAVPFLEEAVRLDPHTPALRFQLGNAYQLTRNDEKALIQFKETLRLDPLNASAHFKLATFSIRAGNRDEYDAYHKEFTRLRRIFGDDARTPAALERCAHTRPEPLPLPPSAPSAPIPVRFSDSTASFLPDESSRQAVAAGVIEVSTNGQPELFTIDASGLPALLRPSPQNQYSKSTAGGKLHELGPIQSCAIGNFTDVPPPGAKYDATLHARNDVLLAGPDGVRLLRRNAADGFIDVTQIAGLSGASGETGAWADYEHDGDADLFLATKAGLRLWQNNGNGTFSNVTQTVGIKGELPGTDVATLELDGNGAVDVLVARGPNPSQVFLNQRAGLFAVPPDPPGPLPPARRILADDLDNNGHLDTVLVTNEGLALLFGQGNERRRLTSPGFTPALAGLFDFDNDGWLDLVTAGPSPKSPDQGALQLWRNEGNRQFKNVTGSSGLPQITLPPVKQLIPVDLDMDNDTDLLLVTVAGTLRVLRNDGGNSNRQLKVQLVGTKTNPMGIGTLVEVRAGAFRVTRWIHQLPIEIGLGQQTQLDSIRTIWTNGVEDNQTDVAHLSRLMRIEEKNVAAGSCPYLYAWDGKGFRFVTDLLGNAPIGLSLRRDVMLPADPDEYVLVGAADAFPVRDGAYELEVTDELREILYLDQVRLVALDHPPGIGIHSTDKLSPAPFPKSELWGVAGLNAPVKATGSDGIDRTGALAEADGVYAPPGAVLPPPLRGITEPLTLTLDFERINTTRPLLLVLTGWIQYGDASVNIAASQQHDLPIIPPTLEAEDCGGQWQPVDVVVGMPAGKTKTILCDLTGKLPGGGTRLRLTTTFELHWDQIALAERVQDPRVQEHELSLRSAELYWRGFSEIRARGPGHPFTPAYHEVTSRPPWSRTPQGWCTRYGNVLELVQSRDDRLAILNGGDALKLRFDAASLPPVPAGLTRTFAFYSVGWDKDEDNNVVTGNTVEPLPVSAPGDWVLEYNTRYVPGNRFQVR